MLARPGRLYPTGLVGGPLVVAAQRRVVRVAALGEVDTALGKPLSAGIPITAAEVVWAVRHEGALSVEDVLERRTRLSLVPADAATAQARVRELVDKSLTGLA